MFIFILYGLTTHKIIDEHNFAFLHSPEIYISAVFGFSNFFPSSSIKFDTFDVDARAINSMPDTRAPISEMKNKPNRITSEVARNEKKLFSRFEEKSIKLVGWVGWKIGIISLPWTAAVSSSAAERVRQAIRTKRKVEDKNFPSQWRHRRCFLSHGKSSSIKLVDGAEKPNFRRCITPRLTQLEFEHRNSNKSNEFRDLPQVLCMPPAWNGKIGDCRAPKAIPSWKLHKWWAGQLK